MQIQVFMGNAGDGNTNKLQEIIDRLNALGKSQPGLTARTGCCRFLKFVLQVASAKSWWTHAAHSRY